MNCPTLRVDRLALVLLELSEVINMIVYDNLPVLKEDDVLREQELQFLDTIEIEEYLKHGEWSVLKNNE